MQRYSSSVRQALSTWTNLNTALRDCAESMAQMLLNAEQEGRQRKQFLLRIHSRLNYLRATRERRELMEERRAAS